MSTKLGHNRKENCNKQKETVKQIKGNKRDTIGANQEEDEKSNKITEVQQAIGNYR